VRALFCTALLLAACSHGAAVPAEPTPFVTKDADAPPPPAQVAAAREREAMPVSSPHAVATRGEKAKQGKSCAADSDCDGRLRCVSYRAVTGREQRQCLFSCLDGCPEGWACQGEVADGPSNTCVQAR
jgi:hypothetical protein